MVIMMISTISDWVARPETIEASISATKSRIYSAATKYVPPETQAAAEAAIRFDKDLLAVLEMVLVTGKPTVPLTKVAGHD